MVGRASGDNSLRCRAARGAVAEDAVTSWSDRMTTGILSWDILVGWPDKRMPRTHEQICMVAKTGDVLSFAFYFTHIIISFMRFFLVTGSSCTQDQATLNA